MMFFRAKYYQLVENNCEVENFNSTTEPSDLYDDFSWEKIGLKHQICKYFVCN